jgi:hypothetical protein
VLVEESRRALLARRLRPSPDLEVPIRNGDPLGQLDCRLGNHTFASVPTRAVRRLEAVPPTASVLPAPARTPDRAGAGAAPVAGGPESR